jgi:hypothetical protein
MNIDEALGKDLERSGRGWSLPQGGKRLLWFLLIPVVLCASALFVAQTRQRESRQLRATTSSLRVQTANQNLAAQTANVQAAAAAVSRLEQMQGFEQIVAPFDGVITLRKTDFGDLVNAAMRVSVVSCSRSRRPRLCEYLSPCLKNSARKSAPAPKPRWT